MTSTTVGDIVNFANVFRLCYIRGPEGLIVELAEEVALRAWQVAILGERTTSIGASASAAMSDHSGKSC